MASEEKSAPSTQEMAPLKPSPLADSPSVRSLTQSDESDLSSQETKQARLTLILMVFKKAPVF